MGKLHFCNNGKPVTQQVLNYQKSRQDIDFYPIQGYYNEYKDHWFNQISDYIDRDTFNSEFDFKLSRAVDKFSDTQSKDLATKYGWNDLGRFNRWFFKILSNWKSNIKTSSFRMKKRPSIQCPVCGRFVGRIDQEHLNHYRALSDLQKFFVWKNHIYETSTLPRVNAVTWGEKTFAKWRDLRKSKTKMYVDQKKRIDWPWRLPSGDKGVMCPFTRKVIARITEEHIRSLPGKFSRYAEYVSWENFIEKFPSSLIQSEVYSLEHTIHESYEGKTKLRDHVASDGRVSTSLPMIDYESICSGDIPSQFEYVFKTIDDIIVNEIDQDILKLLAAGYLAEDVADTLEIDRKEVRRRMRMVRDNTANLEKLLQE